MASIWVWVTVGEINISDITYQAKLVVDKVGVYQSTNRPIF